MTEIIRRHEVLRTVFVMEDDEPVQIISPARPVRISVIDLRHLAENERGGRGDASCERRGTAAF